MNQWKKLDALVVRSLPVDAKLRGSFPCNPVTTHRIDALLGLPILGTTVAAVTQIVSRRRPQWHCCAVLDDVVVMFRTDRWRRRTWDPQPKSRAEVELVPGDAMEPRVCISGVEYVVPLVWADVARRCLRSR